MVRYQRVLVKPGPFDGRSFLHIDIRTDSWTSVKRIKESIHAIFNNYRKTKAHRYSLTPNFCINHCYKGCDIYGNGDNSYLIEIDSYRQIDIELFAMLKEIITVVEEIERTRTY